MLILYRPNSDHRRSVEEFMDAIKRRNDRIKVESINVDSREGSATASLYDIMQYPAIMVKPIHHQSQ